ncbi:MAG: 16S rRNA (guanine(527)-N(7))-methyltransferase RsmG [Bifidobacteriaceae bacterium]|nr:16S rRNA (guanine(527)-N(7))-methyltransferase RsmG [Bifidobacteriaceae bacterium]
MDELNCSPLLVQVLGEALAPLQIFYDKLSAEGEPRGIIGPRDVDIIWERHILNCAAIVPFIKTALGEERLSGKKKGSIADIGSGGGFPGIVIAAMVPQIPITLIEPMDRRVEWLHECVDDMHLHNVTILRKRAEEVPPKPGFDVVTCRAVAPMTKLSGWTLPLVRPHGHLIALKGRSAQAEIDKAAKEIRKHGGLNPRVCEAPVAPGFEPTHVVIVDKKG